MRHRANPRFWQFYAQLSEDIQRLADENYELLKADPRHPSLHFKKVGRMWSVRVGIHYRAVAVEDGSDVVWFWIGHHSEYDRIVAADAASKPDELDDVGCWTASRAMSTFQRGDFVEHDGLLAVVVGTGEDGGAPEDHLALWYGEPRCTRISKGGVGGQHPKTWMVPVEYCAPAASADVRH